MSTWRVCHGSCDTAGGAPLQFFAGREVWAVQIVFIDEEGVPIADFIELLSKSGGDMGARQDICAALAG